MVDFSSVRAIDFHTHAEEPCGCHADDGYDDLQAGMAKYYGAPWSHPPTIDQTAAHFRAAAQKRYPGGPRKGSCSIRASLCDALPVPGRVFVSAFSGCYNSTFPGFCQSPADTEMRCKPAFFLVS